MEAQILDILIMFGCLALFLGGLAISEIVLRVILFLIDKDW